MTLGTAGGMVINVGASTTIQGGGGIGAIDLESGKGQVKNAIGPTELFLNGGTNTLAAQAGGGNVIVTGYSQSKLTISVPHAINGNNFTSASQIPIAHDASGNTLIEVGAASNSAAEIILLAGVGSISSSALTLT